ncbi:MAG TPA: hypothetical protein VHV49_02525 [Pseudonocardiaceae bacterium]|jgi:hypothetical protein|nr:hypothetical protein [Pseudonocardiaceae bacterium]
MSGLVFRPITDALVSHAQATAQFDAGVTGYEPLAAPDDGLACAIWPQTVAPPRGASGLAATSALLTFNARLYTPLPEGVPDTLDARMLDAADALFAAYSGDFNLGGLVRQVDLLGAYGPPLSGTAAYQSFSNRTYRVFTISLGLVVDDVWSQLP